MADLSSKVPSDPKSVLAAAARTKLSPAAVDPTRKKIALAIAAVADAVQLGFFPIFSQGALSIPDDILDVGVVLVLVLVLGFRWRLIASLALELVPFATLFPSWTAVVLSLPVTVKPAAPEIEAVVVKDDA
jgi:hypothetical protein